MKFAETTLILMMACVLGAGGLLAQAPRETSAQPVRPQEAFLLLKTLVGEWQGRAMDKNHGLPIRVSYKLTANESTLVETLFPGTPHEMMTMYHLNGPKQLMLTHYCSAGNQPRMRAEPVTGEVQSLRFTFLDATNLATPGEVRLQIGCINAPPMDLLLAPAVIPYRVF
jgi:hypothetical protein